MKRYASVIELKPEKLKEYMELHAAVWPEIYARISGSNLRNFTIFHRQFPDGKHYLFQYYEYVGTDHVGDCKAIADDPRTQAWWRLTDPCQEGLSNREQGEWWAGMSEVCHND